MLRDRDVALDQRGMQLAQHDGLELATIQIVDVPAVLTVYAMAYTGHASREQGVETGLAARVHDGRLESAAKPEDLSAQLPRADLGPMQRVDGDIRPADPLAKIRVVLDAGDCVTVPCGRHAVDQIHQPVLHPPDHEMMDHVQYERRAPAHHSPRQVNRSASSANSQLMGRRSTL